MGAAGLSEVRSRLAGAASRAGRSADEIELVVVTKGRGPDEILSVYGAGHRVFAESRAQDLVAKMPALPADIRWHFVGPLQRNKVAKVRPAIELLHSLDRPALGEAWTAVDHSPPALLQLNVADEPQKLGVGPDDAAQVVAGLAAMGVDLRGVMAIPPQPNVPEDSRRWFVTLREIRDRLSADWPQIQELSMGMTEDYEVAVEEGATLVRVGRAIFARGG